MKIKETLSEIFFPKGIKCIVCGYELFDDSTYLCKDCKLPKNDNFCIGCGRHIPDMADFCDQCKQRPFSFTAARAPFLYEGNAKRLVRRLKYGGAKYLSEIFAKILADCFYAYGWKVDAVSYVPMHKKRLRSRGYNQAELIAKEFCTITDLPLKDYLERTVYTKNFARMTRAQREKAIKDTIEVKNGESPEKSILLIDDVFTTGTTASECARLLKESKAVAVYVLTFATSIIKPDLY